MSKLNHAKSIRNLASLYRDMESAAEALEQIGSAEQTLEEVRKAVIAERSTLEKLKTQKSAEQEAVNAAHAEALEIIGAANASANEIGKKAASDATNVVALARGKADAMLVDALRKVDEACAGIEERRAKVAQDIDALNIESAGLDKTISVKKAEAEALEQRIAKAQAQIAKLLS